MPCESHEEAFQYLSHIAMGNVTLFTPEEAMERLERLPVITEMSVDIMRWPMEITIPYCRRIAMMSCDNIPPRQFFQDYEPYRNVWVWRMNRNLKEIVLDARELQTTSGILKAFQKLPRELCLMISDYVGVSDKFEEFEKELECLPPEKPPLIKPFIPSPDVAQSMPASKKEVSEMDNIAQAMSISKEKGVAAIVQFALEYFHRPDTPFSEIISKIFLQYVGTTAVSKIFDTAQTGLLSIFHSQATPFRTLLERFEGRDLSSAWVLATKCFDILCIIPCMISYGMDWSKLITDKTFVARWKNITDNMESKFISIRDWPDFASAVAATVADFLDVGWQILTNKFDGYHSKDTYSGWFDEVMSCKANVNRIAIGEITLEDFNKTLDDLKKRGLQKLRKNPKNRSIELVLKEVEDIRASIDTALIATGSRIFPLGILLDGASNSGKSTLAPKLFAIMAAVMGMKYSPELTYNRIKEKFWSTLLTLHRFVFWDEFNVCKLDGIDESEFSQLLMHLNSTISPVPSPIAENKGKIPFNQIGTILSSNNGLNGAQDVMRDPSALIRRIHPIKCRAKKEFANADGGKDDSIPVPEGVCPFEYQFGHYAGGAGGLEFEADTEWVDEETMFVLFRDLCVRHFDRAKKDLHRMREPFDVCTTCFLPNCACEKDKAQSYSIIPYRSDIEHYFPYMSLYLKFVTFLNFFAAYMYFFQRNYNFEISTIVQWYIIFGAIPFLGDMWPFLALSEVVDYYLVIFGQKPYFDVKKVLSSMLSDAGERTRRRLWKTFSKYNLPNIDLVLKDLKVIIVSAASIYAASKLNNIIFKDAQIKYLPEGKKEEFTAKLLKLQKEYGLAQSKEGFVYVNHTEKDVISSTSESVPRDVFVKAISNNVYIARCGIADANAIVLGGQTFIIPAHAIMDHPSLILEQTTFEGQIVSFQIERKLCVERRLDSDILLIKCPTLRPHKSIIKYFPLAPQSQAKYVSLLGWNPENREREIHNCQCKPLTEKRGYTAFVDGVPVRSFMNERIGLEAMYATKQGDSGKLWISQVSNSIIGMHVSTIKVNESTFHGQIYPLSQQDFSSDMFENALSDMDTLNHAQSLGIVEVMPLHERSSLRWMNGRLKPLCSLKRGMSRLRSRVKPTPLREEMEVLHPVRYGAPIFTRIKEDPYSCPWRQNLSVLTEELPYGSSKEIMQAQEIIWGRIEPFVAPTKPLSLHEALNGIDGHKYIHRLRTDTSTGFPQFRKKKTIFPFKGVDIEMDKITQLLYEHRLNEYRHGRVIGCIFAMRLKDECLTLLKILARKLRGFTGSPVDYTILMRQFVLPLCDFMLAQFKNVGSCVGMNVHSPEWQQMYEDLLNFSRQWFDIDYPKFDKRLRELIQMVVVNIFERVAKKAGYSEEDQRVVRCILLDWMFAIYEVKNDLTWIFGGNPSGISLTVLFNNLCNLIYIVSAYVWSGFSDFWANVLVYFYGDDVLGASKNGFGLLHIAEYLKQYGIFVTDGKKNAPTNNFININEAVFLKRRFCEKNGYIIAPLALESIIKSVSWTDSKLPPHVHLSIVTGNALLELSLHDKETFDKYATPIHREYVKCSEMIGAPVIYSNNSEEMFKLYLEIHNFEKGGSGSSIKLDD
jgi:hypothetical protein